MHLSHWEKCCIKLSLYCKNMPESVESQKMNTLVWYMQVLVLLGRILTAFLKLSCSSSSAKM